MLNRRSIFGAVALAPAAVAAASPALGAPAGRRVSCVKGDPGERLYAELCGDGKMFKVLLDGIEQKYVTTADEAEGTVTRFVATPEGRIAFNRSTDEFLVETVRGRVEIIIT